MQTHTKQDEDSDPGKEEGNLSILLTEILDQSLVAISRVESTSPPSLTSGVTPRKIPHLYVHCPPGQRSAGSTL